MIFRGFKTNIKKQLMVFIGVLLITFLITLIPHLFTRQKIENRIGFGISTSANPVVWSEELNASWYLDWKTTPSKASSKPEYWQMIRLSKEGTRPSKVEIIKLLHYFPGHIWIIGNEPDNIWQDNITAEEYARLYHDLYRLIKTHDPSAGVAIGAISQSSPLRLEYLNRVLFTYQDLYRKKMEVDWWTLHAYVLREERQSWGADIPPGFDEKSGQLYEISQHGDIELFKNNILEFRTWMKNNGFQSTPLAITEFGILLPEEFGFSPEDISKYLVQSFTWLNMATNTNSGFEEDDYRLVQKYAWFSLNDKNFPEANLVDLTSKNSPTSENHFVKQQLIYPNKHVFTKIYLACYNVTENSYMEI